MTNRPPCPLKASPIDIVVEADTFTAGEATITFPRPLPSGQLYLLEYMVDGVDVTAGIPDARYFRISLGDSLSSDPLPGNLTSGFLLPLTGVRTHVVTRGRVVGKIEPIGRETTLRVEDHTGAVPTVSSIVLFLRVDPERW